MPGRVDEDVRLLQRRAGMFEHEQHAILALGLQRRRVFGKDPLEGDQRTVAQLQGGMSTSERVWTQHSASWNA